MNVPRKIFRGVSAEPDPKEKAEFGRILQSRYPWLTDNSLEVFFRNAQAEMLRVLDYETGGRNESRRLEAEGKIEAAIKHLKKHLEEDPEDADSWYELGNLLCKAGRTDEGYKAFNKGRSLF